MITCGEECNPPHVFELASVLRPVLPLSSACPHKDFHRGLLLLGCGESAIRFCPPLCVTDAELELGVRLFEQAVVDAG